MIWFDRTFCYKPNRSFEANQKDIGLTAYFVINPSIL